jgi:hypothetical protein
MSASTPSARARGACAAKNPAASSTVMASTSAIVRPFQRTPSVSSV